MKLSTRGRYALRMMLDIALHPDESSVSLKSIAQRQGISVKYLEQILSKLVSSNLVEGTRGINGGYRLTRKAGEYMRASRGAQGGYQLNRPPEEYTVGTILRTIEGSLAPVACLEGGEELCDRQDRCVTVEVYRRIDEAIDNVVDRITLKDLVDLQHEKWGGDVAPEGAVPDC